MTIHSFFRGMTPQRCLGLAMTVLVLGIVACFARSGATAAAGTDVTGDAKHGQDLFQRRCTSCHNLDTEKEGPRLRGVFGRKSASISTFTYSDALKGANLTWDAANLDKWLTDTDKFIPDNDMNISLKNPDERADIIAYLKSLSN
jgi:cytochrome c